MADWKVRGYVSDSDEEEDSQEGDGFGAENADSGSSNWVDNAGESQKQEDLGGTQAKAVEVRIPGQNKVNASGENEVDIWAFDGEDEIDELQEDHYTSAASSAQPQAELSAGNVVGKSVQDIQSQAKAGTDPEELPLGPQVKGASFPEDQFRAPDLIAETDKRPRSPIVRSGQNLSRQSSPLSEPSSLPDISQMLASRVRGDDDVQLAHPLVASPQVQEAIRHEPAFAQADLESRARRNLRQRNPIQLHPYAIEGEKYRQFLHARGVRALRFAQADSQAQLTEDSQNQAFQGSQFSGSSSPNAPRSPISSPPPTELPQLEDEEFPDMDALLRQQAHHYSSHGYKRRKKNRSRFKPPPAAPPRIDAVNETRHTPLSDMDDDMYDVPPSPPPSGTQTPGVAISPYRPRFQIPVEAPIRPLPTPVTSSEPRRPPQKDVLSVQSSDSESDVARPIEIDSGPSTPRSEDDSSNRLHQVKRKIRGVLPASWLKLDLKTQTKGPDKFHRPLTSASPEKRDSHKGVARPVLRTGKTTPSRPSSNHEMFVLSDDERSSDEAQIQQRAAYQQSDTINIPDDDDITLAESRFGEAAEDDEVDAMLPKARRLFHHSRKPNKRQKRMSDYGVQSSTRDTYNARRIQPEKKFQGHLASTSTAAKGSKPRFRPPKLSILDVPEHGNPAPLLPQYSENCITHSSNTT